MKYLWTEDTGAGLHFWKLVNQLFFDNALVVESKESNQGILDSLISLNAKEEDEYYIAFDYVPDNQDIRNKYRQLKQLVEKSEAKVIILDMICFEYFILAFDKLVSWTGTGKTDKIKMREDILAAIEDHRIDLSKIDNQMTMHYLSGFKRYSSGLSDISYDNISKLLDRKYIDGVQVVNDEIWENYGNEPLHIISEKLTEKYGKTITDEQAKAWISVYQQVKNSGFPLLSFSDNPYSEKSSKHGMWGIGASYTYLKMSQTPNLESVRQALISNDMRVEKNAESNHMIGESPDMIIREVVLSNSILNENAKIDVSFNSQLNTIIGGRGSGKSSIIRTIAGGMNSFSGENLNIISQEQMEFYKENGKTKSSNIKKGIFTKNSVVEILVERLGDLYKIEVSHIKNMQNQTRKLYKYINDNWQLVEDENFIDLFKAQIFTQKQIYELATDSNSLMAIIDGDISGMSNCVSEREAALNNLIGKALEISNCRRSIAKKSKLETELADIEDQISKFKQSGISDIIKEKQLYDDQQKVISSYVENKNNKIEEIETFIKQVNLTYDLIDDSEINEILDDDLKDFNSDIESIYKILHDIVKKSDKIVEKINATNWNHRKIENGENYLQAVKNLQDNGLDTGRLDELIDKRKDKKQELEIIRNKEQELEALEQEYNEKEKIYKEKNADIYNLRSQFIQEVIGNDKSVKFDLKKNRNRSSFINNIRSIIQKDIVSVEDDINKLADIFFKDKNGIKNYKELIVNIRTKQDQTSLSLQIKSQG